MFRRIARIFVRTAAWLSLILASAIAGAWAQGPAANFGLTGARVFTGPPTIFFRSDWLVYNSGRIVVEAHYWSRTYMPGEKGPPPTPHSAHSFKTFYPGAKAWDYGIRRIDEAGVKNTGFHRGKPRRTAYECLGLRFEKSDGPDLGESDWCVFVPCSWLLALFSVLPALEARRLWRARRLRRRRARGACGSCGYDLRGSPGRCPECGAEPAKAAADGRAKAGNA